MNFFLFASAMLACGAASAQAQKFEVASIRPIKSCDPGGGGCVFCCPLSGWPVGRVFGVGCGFAADEDSPPASGVSGVGTLTWGTGALFCGLGASGNFSGEHRKLAVRSNAEAAVHRIQ